MNEKKRQSNRNPAAMFSPEEWQKLLGLEFCDELFEEAYRFKTEAEECGNVRGFGLPQAGRHQD